MDNTRNDFLGNVADERTNFQRKISANENSEKKISEKIFSNRIIKRKVAQRKANLAKE
jgi:hypothetical protein